MAQFQDTELDGVELTGERLTLRRWHPDDADRVHAVMQNHSMRDFLALPDPYTPAEASRFVQEFGVKRRTEGTGLDCAVVARDSGLVVGSASIWLTGDAEIGYWVAPDAQGKGYAAEATRLLYEWGFALGLRRIRLACDVRNLASARSALAAGFQFEGVSRDGITSGGRGPGPAYRGDLARFGRLPSDPPGRTPLAFVPLPDGGLDDGVLRLRAVESADARALAETDDAVALKWNFTGVAPSLHEVQRGADQAGLEWLVGRVAALAMVDVASGRVAGSLRLRKQGPPQVGGIGYGVHPAFRGRGFTTRALRLLVPWAFDVADFARLELGAKVGNEASARAAAAAGFEPDGIRQRRLRNPDGAFSDEVRYALINPRFA